VFQDRRGELRVPVLGQLSRRNGHLATLAVASFLTLDLGYAVYTEHFGGAQEGIIDVGPAPYEVR
jgi:hypothetical protein